MDSRGAAARVTTIALRATVRRIGSDGPRHPAADGDRCRVAHRRPRRSPALVCALLGVTLLLAACGMPPATKGAGAPKSVPTTVAPTSRSSTTTTGPRRVSGFVAQSASFVTESDGFVLGDTACAVGTCTAILHTTDRGAEWSALSAPPTAISAQGAGGVSELHFADQLDGWVYGDTLWATHDGGNTWNQLRLGGSIVAMASGLGVAYALVQACASCSPPADSVRLYRSAVGADAWALVPGVDLSGQPELVAEGATVFLLSGNPTEILRSSNGAPFVALTNPCPADPDSPGLGPLSMAASDPSDLAFLCSDGAAAGSSDKEVFISHDGGVSYERVPDAPFGGDAVGLAMPSPTTVLVSALSGASEIYRLAPPDTTWTTPLTFGDGGAGLHEPAFVDPTDGSLIHGSALQALSLLSNGQSVAGLGELYLTDDAGAFWNLVSVGG